MDLEVQRRVQMPVVDLLGVTVALQETTQNTGSANPESLCRHTCLSSTATLTWTPVASLQLELGLLHAPPKGKGVDGNRLADDNLSLNQLTDVRP